MRVDKHVYLAYLMVKWENFTEFLPYRELLTKRFDEGNITGFMGVFPIIVTLLAHYFLQSNRYQMAD